MVHPIYQEARRHLKLGDEAAASIRAMAHKRGSGPVNIMSQIATIETEQTATLVQLRSFAAAIVTLKSGILADRRERRKKQRSSARVLSL